MFKKSFKKTSCIIMAMLCVITFFPSMTQAATAVGQPLLTAEEGWTRYDDTYATGTIPAQTSTSYYQSTAQWTQTPGKYTSFKFYGTKLRLLTYSASDHASNVSVKVDGVSYSYKENYGSAKLTLVFEKTDLVEGLHTVVIESVNSNVYTSLDAIDVNKEGYVLPPYTPTNLKANPGVKEVVLSWDKVAEADSYKIQYGTKSKEYSNTVTVSKDVYTGFPITNLENGTPYYFLVTSIVGGKERSSSDEATATPQAAVPTEPSTPPVSSTNRAVLTIILENGLEKKYDLSTDEVNRFVSWYEANVVGTHPASFFAIDAQIQNKPFVTSKDYIIFNRILFFEINGYNS